MAVLVAAMTLAWPMLRGAFESVRLQKGADLVRSEMSAARVKALTSGEIHALRWQPGASQFQIERWRGPDSALESADAAGNSEAAPAEASTVVVDQFTLPEGIAFGEADLPPDARAQQNQLLGKAPAAADGLSVLFYPDGSTSTATLLLQSSRGEQVAVELRGITGVSKLIDVPAAGVSR